MAVSHFNHPMSSITSLSAQQLRHAADLKEKISSLEKQLAQMLGASSKSVSTKAPVKKFRMSAAARAKISAAAKARWAKVNGAKPAAKPAAKAKPAPKKKAPAKKTKLSAAAKAKLSELAKARWAKVKSEGKKAL
jgi:hypothetical protein